MDWALDGRLATAQGSRVTYATTCSKPRLGEFGGGAVFVTADDNNGKPQSYMLRIDGPLFRRQRQALLKVMDGLFRGEPDGPEAGDDKDLLAGVVALCDEIADQAHDRHGIDCLLEEQG